MTFLTRPSWNFRSDDFEILLSKSFFTGGNMRQKLEQRLEQLKAEFEAGQKMLTELEAKQANVRETMLRISGAIQVLEEELSNDTPPNAEKQEK